MNRVILSGHLGRDPQKRFSNGRPVAIAPLATTNRWKDRETGERRESTEWHRIVHYGDRAENFARICQKGSHVQIEGHIRYRTHTDTNNVPRQIAEIIVENWELLSGGRQNEEGANAPVAPSDNPPQDDDIPIQE